MGEKASISQLTVISGKGGTGKTSIAACFAAMFSGQMALADCDVDAANLGLVLGAAQVESHEFIASKKAVIRRDLCTGCGECERVCRSDAVAACDETFRVDPLACEGCGVCGRVCPVGAIAMHDAVSGRWFLSDTPYGPLVHARLHPGEENSGKLVTVVRNKAKEIAETQSKRIVMIDGPPGIGCPVIASIAGTSFALVVVEPSYSGIHDMQRVMAVCRHFGVKHMVCINRYDIHEEGSREIERFCARNEVEVVGRIPFDRTVTEALLMGLPVTEYSDSAASKQIRRMSKRVLDIVLDSGS